MIITGTFCFELQEGSCFLAGNLDAPDYICTGQTLINKSPVFSKPYVFQTYVPREQIEPQG